MIAQLDKEWLDEMIRQVVKCPLTVCTAQVGVVRGLEAHHTHRRQRVQTWVEVTRDPKRMHAEEGERIVAATWAPKRDTPAKAYAVSSHGRLITLGLGRASGADAATVCNSLF